MSLGPRLKDLGAWSSGGTPPKDREDLWAGEFPWVSAKDFDDDRLREPTTFITEDAARSHSRIARPDNILLIVRGMALAHGVPVVQTSTRVAFNQDLRALNVAPQYAPRFIYYALRGHRSRLNAHIDQAAHGTARLIDSVVAERIQAPGREMQARVADFLDRECARIGALGQRIEPSHGGLLGGFEALLTEYRDALIAEAVTGRLDVARLSEQQLEESGQAALEGERPEVLA